MECNICGGDAFKDYKTRGPIRCVECGSIERTRILWLYLQKFAGLRPGLRVLHFAPERPLFPRIAKIVGTGYDVRDIDIERYKRFRENGISVTQFDLCADLDSLPSDRYDLILHNHVIEHLKCNVTAVLWHLHRALAPDGLHMFSIPIIRRDYDESFADLSDEVRVERFGQHDHIRNFSRQHLPETLGMLFDIDDIISQTLPDIFGEDALRRYNIPTSRWRNFNGGCLFILEKDRLRLREGR